MYVYTVYVAVLVTVSGFIVGDIVSCSEGVLQMFVMS